LGKQRIGWTVAVPHFSTDAGEFADRIILFHTDRIPSLHPAIGRVLMDKRHYFDMALQDIYHPGSKE
jgi:hypothetical protein